MDLEEIYLLLKYDWFVWLALRDPFHYSEFWSNVRLKASITVQTSDINKSNVNDCSEYNFTYL
ncbi:1842_t:CDS:2, partial [Funneliformis mosseae]